MVDKHKKDYKINSFPNVGKRKNQPAITEAKSDLTKGNNTTLIIWIFTKSPTKTNDCNSLLCISISRQLKDSQSSLMK